MSGIMAGVIPVAACTGCISHANSRCQMWKGARVMPRATDAIIAGGSERKSLQLRFHQVADVTRSAC